MASTGQAERQVSDRPGEQRAGMPQSHALVVLDTAWLDVLHTAYLLRPARRSELREAMDPVPPDFDRVVDDLIRTGFVREDHDHLTIESPEVAFAAFARICTQHLVTQAAATVRAMADLPTLVRAWELGQAEGDAPVSATVVRCMPGEWGTWFDYVEQGQPGTPVYSFVDTEVLETAIVTGHLERLSASSAPAPLRVLLAPMETGPRLASRMEDATRHGVQFRFSRHVGSWWYVDAGRVLGLPARWGDAAPGTVYALRSQAVVDALASYADDMWHLASRATPFAEPWQEVMELLAGGLSDDRIAARLHVATRTVRRRIAQAMTELDATSRFQLGALWQAQRSSSAPSGRADAGSPPSR